MWMWFVKSNFCFLSIIKIVKMQAILYLCNSVTNLAIGLKNGYRLRVQYVQFCLVYMLLINMLGI